MVINISTLKIIGLSNHHVEASNNMNADTPLLPDTRRLELLFDGSQGQDGIEI